LCLKPIQKENGGTYTFANFGNRNRLDLMFL